MLASETLDGRNGNAVKGSLLLGIGRNVDDGNLLAVPCAVGIRAIEHHMHLEGLFDSRFEVQHEAGIVASLGALESKYALSILGQTTEAEVLEADDALVGDAGKVHAVVPDVEVILHPVLVGEVASDAGRIILIRIETENLEALGSDLSTRITVAVAGLGNPSLLRSVRIVARDADLTTIGHFLLVPLNLDRSHHWLTGITEAAWWAVIEDIPLAIDELQRTVGIVS